MEFKEKIKELGNNVITLKENVLTEEATKMAFVVPLIQVLGYNPFNPLEVSPEYITDLGIKKGEKIDYVILNNLSEPTMLIECKHWGKNLDLFDSQLLRYFHVSKARFGILTNGITYRFYTDLLEPNKMDIIPFLEFDITNIKPEYVEQLRKFHKTNFNVDNILNTANELKYSNEIKKVLQNEINAPSPEFVKHFIKQVYNGNASTKIVEYFTELIKKSFNQHINDIVTDRLNKALNTEKDVLNKTDEDILNISLNTKTIETTGEEIEGFHIIKYILKDAFGDTSRLSYRDAQTYFAIILDDNNRKTVCRLYLNKDKKSLVLLDDEKKEIKYNLNSVEDIQNYKNEIIEKIKLLS